MISATNRTTPFLTEFTNGKVSSLSDTSEEKGGQGAGFGPHELLEASVATCFNIVVRMSAEKHHIAVGDVYVEVNLFRTETDTTFQYRVDLKGDLSEEQRVQIHDAVVHCPLHKTLTRKISFEGTMNVLDE